MNENQMKDAKCTKVKSENPIEMDNAINEIESVINHINELLDRISIITPVRQEDKNPEIQKAPPERITLEGVLLHGPTRIRSKCDILHEKIETLSNILL